MWMETYSSSSITEFSRTKGMQMKSRDFHANVPEQFGANTCTVAKR